MLRSLLPRVHSAGKRPFLSFLNPFAKVQGTTIQKLAKQEHVANANLSDAAAQTALYRELLASQYPKLVVHRFEMPGVARNAEAERLYMQALQMCDPTRAQAVREKGVAGLSGAGAGAGASAASSVGANSTVSAALQFANPMNSCTARDPRHLVLSVPPLPIPSKRLQGTVPR